MANTSNYGHDVVKDASSLDVHGSQTESYFEERQANIADITDNSGGTASDTIAAISGPKSTVTFGPIPLDNGTGVVANYTPSFDGAITKLDAIVTTVTTDCNATLTVNAEIGGTNVSGGVVTVDDTGGAAGDAATPIGNELKGTAITGDNTFSADDEIEIEFDETTDFSDGEIIVVMEVEDYDARDLVRNAVASLADHVNDLITAVEAAGIANRS